MQCCREAVKFAAWEVRTQVWNLKEVAGEHHKGWSLRFNWSQRQKSYPERQQNEGQAEDFTRQAERWCMAVASSCREMSC